MTATPISFSVRGLPVPQGSARAFVVKGRPIITSANRGLAAWRRLVSDTAQDHAPRRLLEGPVALTVAFRFPRPKSRRITVGRGKKKRRIKVWPDRKPDLDKLIRTIGDSLSNVIFHDDCQVVRIHASKDYGVPGVKIEIRRVGE